MPEYGHCKLTRKEGRFVKSHIIPRALTDLALDKVARIQYGGGNDRPSLRFTSWYDESLVIDEGERKLAKIDDDAIKVIEKLGISWRYFPLKQENVSRTNIDGTDFEIIQIQTDGQPVLKLFFLSLLWRASFSSRRECRTIRLDILSREKLRKIINGEVKPGFADFPCVLVLMTTVGPPQVDTPRRDRMAVPQIAPNIRPSEKIFRFFLNGLIVHIGRKASDFRLAENWRWRNVGVSEKLILIGRPYEGSRQMEVIDSLEDELEMKWPEQAKTIYGVIEKHG
jgi:hypothetical protein